MIQRSLDLHAERVAKRLRTEEPTPRVNAASRIAALRARVAAKAAAACDRPAASGDDHNIANAATRVAVHAIHGEPLAGEGRQLTG